MSNIDPAHESLTSGNERSSARAMWTLFAAAFVVRIVLAGVVGTPGELASKDVWTFGFEAAAIGKSIADGDGFGNLWLRPQAPWDAPSGATAWLPPAYPALLAVLMKAFGGLSLAMVWALVAVQSAVSAATCVVLVRLGEAIGEPRAGRVAGWVLALYPVAIWHAIHTVWDTTLAACALTLFLWQLLRRDTTPTMARAVVLGALFALVLWVNPAPTAIAPVAIVVLARRGGTPPERLTRALAFAGAAFAVCLPWMIRNQREVRSFGLRSNLGVELAVGNNDRANGHYQPALHPSFDPAQFERYRELGEAAYARGRMVEARAWIREHASTFVGLTWRRVRIFWVGETPYGDPRRDGTRSARDDPKSWIKWANYAAFGFAALVGAAGLARAHFEGRALAAVMVLFPLAYYVTHFMERYRYPIEPVIILAATWVALAVVDRVRARPRVHRMA